MKSMKTLSIALLTVAVVGTQLNAMSGMAQSVPTKVPFGMRFMDRVRNGGVAQRAVFAPSFTMTSPEIQVQQELLDQSAGFIPAAEQVSQPSFMQKAQTFAHNAYSVVLEKAHTVKTAVAEKAHELGTVVAEKAKNAYHNENVQSGLAKVAQLGHNALAQSKVYAQSLVDKSHQAVDYVKENPKVAAGIVFGAVATGIIYKMVRSYQMKKHMEKQPLTLIDMNNPLALSPQDSV